MRHHEPQMGLGEGVLQHGAALENRRVVPGGVVDLPDEAATVVQLPGRPDRFTHREPAARRIGPLRQERVREADPQDAVVIDDVVEDEVAETSVAGREVFAVADPGEPRIRRASSARVTPLAVMRP